MSNSGVPRRVSRRSAIGTGLACVSSIGVLSGCQDTAATSLEQPAETVPRDARLRDLAARRGLKLGTAVQSRYLARQDNYVPVLTRDFDLLVPEYEAQWKIIDSRPGSGRYDNVGRILDFAEANDMAVRGHAPYWHGLQPDWLNATLASSPERAERLLSDRIAGIAGRYRGRVRSWDVLNEVIEPDDGRSDGLRRTAFLTAMGPGYIDLAFRAARAADPAARLVLNEYRTEWAWPQGRKRRDALLRLLEGLLSRGVPVDAVGVQGHLAPALDGYLNAGALGEFCREVAGMGLTLSVTELDARDTGLRGSRAERDQSVADAYARFLDVMLAQPALDAVLTWGFSDRYSWFTKFFPRADGQRVRGTLYDVDYVKKRSWFAVANALAGG